MLACSREIFFTKYLTFHMLNLITKCHHSTYRLPKIPWEVYVERWSGLPNEPACSITIFPFRKETCSDGNRTSQPV